MTISDPDILRFEDGVVTALQVGTATIAFAALDGSGVTATATVTVQPRLVQFIQLSRVLATLQIGGQFSLSASTWPQNTTNPALEYTVSDPDVISFENGVVTALQVGTATITFTALDGSGATARTTVTVREPVLVQSIRLRQNAVSIYVDDILPLTPHVTVLPSNAANQRFEISANNPAVLRLEGDRIIGLAPGTATVTFAALDGSGTTATATITVQERGFFGQLFDALSANSGGGCGSGGSTPRVRIPYRMAYNSYAAGVVASMEMNRAWALFSNNFNINLALTTHGVATVLNHGCPRSACDANCGPLANCRVQHHRSAVLRLGMMQQAGVNTFRFVDYRMCGIVVDRQGNIVHTSSIPGFEIPGMAWSAPGRDMIVSTVAQFLPRTVIHEITHLFGALDYVGCTPGQRNQCVMHSDTHASRFDVWCDNCTLLVMANRYNLR